MNRDDYNGLYSTNPRLAVVMMLAMFSLGGIPPFAGFFSKFFIFAAAAEQGEYLLVFLALATIIISLLLSAGGKGDVHQPLGHSYRYYQERQDVVAGTDGLHHRCCGSGLYQSTLREHHTLVIRYLILIPFIIKKEKIQLGFSFFMHDNQT